MKLLPKRVVNAEVALQKKRDIDAGLELARKVDTLRETLADEEKNLEQFRSHTIQSVQMEVDAKIRERNALEAENARRRDEIRNLAPLNLKKEWARVADDKREIEGWKQHLAVKEVELVAKEGDNVVFLENLSKAKHQVEEKTILTNRTLHEAQEKFEQASITLEKHQKEADKILQRAQSKEKEVIEREVEADYRERNLTEREEQVQDHEKDLSDRERALTDKYNTFIRAQSYMANKNK